MIPNQATPFNRRRTLKNGVCLALLLALSLAIISLAAPAFADTWSLSAKPNRTNYVQGALVTINGTLTDTTTGAAGVSYIVSISVYDSAGTSVYSQVVATGTTGAYSTQFTVSSNDPNGTYSILASAVEATTGQQIAKATATFSVGTTPAPTPSTTPSATPTTAPSNSSTPKVPEFSANLVLAALIVTAIASAAVIKTRKSTERELP